MENTALIAVAVFINFLLLISVAFTLYFAWRFYQTKLETKYRRRFSRLVQANKQLKQQFEASELKFGQLEVITRTNSAQLTKPKNLFDNSEKRHIEELNKVVEVNGKPVSPTG